MKWSILSLKRTKAFSQCKRASLHNPALIPAPLALPAHNTHYGEWGRVRVE